jgi:hypothetical protein
MPGLIQNRSLGENTAENFCSVQEESEAVPSDYLQYMLTQDLNGYTRQAFVNALAWREQASIADD